MPEGEQPGESKTNPEPAPAQKPEPESKPSVWQRVKSKASSLANKAASTLRTKEAEQKYQAQTKRNKPLQDWRDQKEKIRLQKESVSRQKERDILKEKVRQKSEKLKAGVSAVREKIHAAGERTGENFRKSSLYSGMQLGAQEATEKFDTAMHRGGRAIGRLPYTVAEKGYGMAKDRYSAMKDSVRMQRQQGDGRWHAGLLWNPGSQRASRGTVPGKIKYRGRPSGLGRQPRSAIPRGTIKPYWSKKLKKLARTNIHRFGLEDGMAKTRQVAQELHWKMQ